MKRFLTTEKQGGYLAMDMSDMKEVLTYLILELDKQTFNSRLEEDRPEILNESRIFGSVKLEQSVETIRKPFERIIHFDLFVEGPKHINGILGYASFLYGSSKVLHHFRETLLEKESIHSVITVKHTGNTGRQVAILLFNKTEAKTKLVTCESIDAASAYIAGTSSEGIEVNNTDIISPENMLPGYYSEPLLQVIESSGNTVIKKLEEVAEVISGKSASSYDYRSEGIPYLRARDIQQGEIIKPDVFLSSDKAKQFSKQLLQDGDILLTKHFGQRKLALVCEDNLPAIASDALFIIRPFGVSENYLYRYLTSKTGNTVFNEQLKRIEHGVVVPSMRLSDLKRVEVPIFDDDTMSDLEHMDTLSEHEGIESALRLLNNIGNADEKAIETRVINDLITAGWDASQLQMPMGVNLTNKERIIADLIYILPDGVKVYFEIKSRLSGVSQKWIRTMKEILHSPEKCFYVLTTGLYYETHVSGRNESLKSTNAPTIEELIKWEGGLK